MGCQPSVNRFLCSLQDLESDDPQDESETRHQEPRRRNRSLEDDPRLLELAKQAALCAHEILGVSYDESQGVDIGDIKFVVAVLSLPLGGKCNPLLV
jgi:hypothetical protein